MVGYGVDYQSPRPPFVIFRFLWQYSLGIWFRPLWLVVCVFVRFFAGAFGFSAGFFGHLDDVTTDWTAPVDSAKSVTVEGMDGDEYI